MTKVLTGVVIVAAMAGFGCSAQADVEKVPVGAEVAVTKQDGGLIEGKLTDRDPATVKIQQGRATTTLDRKDIADVRVVDPTKPAEAPPAKAKFREFTLPEGTTLRVRLETAVASDVNKSEDPVEATLTAPVVIRGIEVFSEGSAVKGFVSSAQPSGKVKGRASLALRFTTVIANGESYSIVAGVSRLAPATKGEDAKKVGIGAAGGAVVGALIGGGKGAAVGSVVGGGAGTAVVPSTAGDEVKFPSGTAFALDLDKAVDVKVPIKR